MWRLSHHPRSSGSVAGRPGVSGASNRAIDQSGRMPALRPRAHGRRREPVITIKQPMADAIFTAQKDIENRHGRIRDPDDGGVWLGRLWINAGQDPNRSRFDRWANERGVSLPEEPLVRGAIIGCVELYDIVGNAESIWASPTYRYHWKLRRPKLLVNPVPWQGAQHVQWIRPPRGKLRPARARRRS
jgi:hypothetical protein